MAFLIKRQSPDIKLVVNLSGTLESPEKLVKMSVFGFYPRQNESELLVMGPKSLWIFFVVD